MTVAVEPRRSRRRWIVAAAGMLVVAVVVGVVLRAVHVSQVAPFAQPVVTVDDSALSMGYFVARLAARDGAPLEMLDTLVREQILRISAPAPPFGIDPDDAELDAFLRDVAQGGGTEMGAAEFDAWYRQQLNESRMSEADFRLAARMELIRARMTDHFAAEVPERAPQVRLSMLAANTLEEAQSMRERIAAGESFATLAAASVDAEFGESQGDLGWLPRAALSDSLAALAFDSLRPGDVSAPLSRVDRPGFLLIQVAERDEDRSVSPAAAHRAGARMLEEWLNGAYAEHRIELGGLDGGAFDSATETWVRAQVARLRGEGG